MTLLASLERRMEAPDLDLDRCPGCELESLAAAARAGLARVEGYLTRLAGAARRREAAGEGVAADDVIRGEGELSRARAEAVSARAAVGEALPALGSAISAGSARPENADAAASVVGRLSDGERSRLKAHDEELARRAATDAPEAFARHLQARAREVRDRPDHEGLSRAERAKARSHLALGRKLNGLWWLSGELADEWGAPINDQLRARARYLAGNGPVTPNHMAQALFELVTGVPVPGSGMAATRTPAPGSESVPGSEAVAGSACGSQPAEGAGPRRMGIGYIIDAATLLGLSDAPGSDGGPTVVAETWGGDPVEPEVIRRLACDADLYAVLIGAGGEPRGVHRTHRSADRDQRLQLRVLYPTCPLDGTTPFERCEIHHVNLAHRHGGATILANLVPISSRWHHRIHDLGWQLTMRPDRTLELRTPDGTLHRIIPPPAPITRQRE